MPARSSATSGEPEFGQVYSASREVKARWFRIRLARVRVVIAWVLAAIPIAIAAVEAGEIDPLNAADPSNGSDEPVGPPCWLLINQLTGEAAERQRLVRRSFAVRLRGSAAYVRGRYLMNGDGIFWWPSDRWKQRGAREFTIDAAAVQRIESLKPRLSRRTVVVAVDTSGAQYWMVIRGRRPLREGAGPP